MSQGSLGSCVGTLLDVAASILGVLGEVAGDGLDVELQLDKLAVENTGVDVCKGHVLDVDIQTLLVRKSRLLQNGVGGRDIGRSGGEHWQGRDSDNHVCVCQFGRMKIVNEEFGNGREESWEDRQATDL